jgi:hypothetical protein
MKKKSTTAFVIGAKPPQKLSPLARKQLSSAKPSLKAQKMAENASRFLNGGCSFCADKAATEPTSVE